MNARRSLVASLALLAACSGTGPNPQPVTRQAALESFKGPNACADLERYIEDTAVQMMRTQLEQQRDAISEAYGRAKASPNVGLSSPEGAQAGAAAEDASTTSAAAPSAPSDYTTTNNQVQGVDEADFVKNDGTRIFVLSGGSLHAVKSWPAAEAAALGKVKIDGWPRELFLDGKDKAVVFSTVYKSYPLAQNDSVCAARSMSCGYYYSNSVKITVVDVSNMGAMKVTESYELPGHYNSARKIGSAVRVVLSDDFNWPKGVQFYPTYEDYNWSGGQLDIEKLKQAYTNLIIKNEPLIRAQPLAAWLPSASLTDQSGTRDLGYDCGDFSKVNAPTKLGTVSVVTLNLEQQTLDQRTIVSEPGEIYASLDNLYLATRHWWWWPALDQEDATYIHKFDIRSPDEAKYVASGTVSGHIVDQFSMDENAAGFFRIVTTISTRVPDLQFPQNRWGRTETTNRLWVFAEKNGTLTDVGRSELLAKGERVMSSRFVGNKAFVVTFRQIDPLFTFDLTDPTNPKKIGELKIPGFSTYIHPLDENHLLTIGTYVPENGPQTWNTRAVQLQIFDVSDLANPTQTHSQIVGTAYSWSEAMYDHRAFNYFPAKKLLAIPFSDWNMNASDYWSSFTSDLRVFSVDAETGFTAKGALSLGDLYQARQTNSWTYYWMPNVRRSVMADDFVYAISDAGVRVANIADLSTPIATAEFAPTTITP
ncbi:MAG: beta-propeller domain-containing protein [Deltaproteobacteria bacterium]|nr:beta-propeller domain-containing protein [Deltaproteobacteria bacterium]